MIPFSIAWLFMTTTACLPTVTPEKVSLDTAVSVVLEPVSDAPAGNVTDTATGESSVDSPEHEAEPEPEAEVEHYRMAIVAGLSRDYSHGAVSTIDLEDWTINDSIVPTSGDVVVSASDDIVFVINRLNTDTIQVFSGPLTVPDLDLGMPDLSNPQDAVVCNDEYWVTLHNASVIPRYNALGLRTGETDISEWTGTDGHAEAASIVLDADGSHIHVALQQLKQDDGWTSDGGVVVTISCSTGAVVGVQDVGPSPSIVDGPSIDTLGYKTGLYGALDGEVGTIMTRTAERVVHATESDVGGDIGAFAYFDNHLVYASSDADWVFTVHCLNLATGETSQMGPLNQYVSDIASDTHGRFWLSFRPGWASSTVEGVGVEIIDPSSCTSLIPSGQPLQFTLPPSSLAFR